MRILALVFFTLFIVSCASLPSKTINCYHYGIQVDGESYDDKYIRGVSYLPSVMNPKINARGCLPEHGKYFKLEVRNESDNPINLNYFLDRFELFTNDGKKYMLEPRGGIARYPEKKYINPQESIWFSVNPPKGLKSENDVAKIVVKLGWDARIVLKPKFPKASK